MFPHFRSQVVHTDHSNKWKLKKQGTKKKLADIDVYVKLIRVSNKHGFATLIHKAIALGRVRVFAVTPKADGRTIVPTTQNVIIAPNECEVGIYGTKPTNLLIEGESPKYYVTLSSDDNIFV